MKIKCLFWTLVTSEPLRQEEWTAYCRNLEPKPYFIITMEVVEILTSQIITEASVLTEKLTKLDK